MQITGVAQGGLKVFLALGALQLPGVCSNACPRPAGEARWWLWDEPLDPKEGSPGSRQRVGSLSQLAVATVVLAGQEVRGWAALGAPRHTRGLCSAGGDTALAED